jgi:hypothetical protein
LSKLNLPLMHGVVNARSDNALPAREEKLGLKRLPCASRAVKMYLNVQGVAVAERVCVRSDPGNKQAVTGSETCKCRKSGPGSRGLASIRGLQRFGLPSMQFPWIHLRTSRCSFFAMLAIPVAVHCAEQMWCSHRRTSRRPH